MHGMASCGMPTCMLTDMCCINACDVCHTCMHTRTCACMHARTHALMPLHSYTYTLTHALAHARTPERRLCGTPERRLCGTLERRLCAACVHVSIMCACIYRFGVVAQHWFPQHCRCGLAEGVRSAPCTCAHTCTHVRTQCVSGMTWWLGWSESMRCSSGSSVAAPYRAALHILRMSWLNVDRVLACCGSTWHAHRPQRH